MIEAVRNRLSVLGHNIVMVLLSLLLFTGCNVWEDLPECPPATGRVWVGFTFTYHNVKDDKENYVDLFGETARRTDLFIFDSNNLLVKVIEDITGPFENGYRLPIDLPAGLTMRWHGTTCMAMKQLRYFRKPLRAVLEKMS